MNTFEGSPLDIALHAIRMEYESARRKHRPMHSAHEGYAVIAEEFDELWENVKHDNPLRAKAEAVQVGAMALAFLLEVPE